MCAGLISLPAYPLDCSKRCSIIRHTPGGTMARSHRWKLQVGLSAAGATCQTRPLLCQTRPLLCQKRPLLCQTGQVYFRKCRGIYEWPHVEWHDQGRNCLLSGGYAAGMEINTRHTPFAGGFVWWRVNCVTSPATVSARHHAFSVS